MFDETDLALSLADDLFVQCQTLSPWTVNYVDLEESLAVGSIAQEVLAHGGVLYGLAGCQPSERDARIYARPASEWSVADLSFLPSVHWPDLVASAYLNAQASKVVVDALMERSERARQALALVHSEQSLHIMHWRRWISMLTGAAEVAVEMRAAIQSALGRSGDVLPTGDQHDALHHAWADAVSVDLVGWGVPTTQIPGRVPRTAGGAKITSMVDDLRVARASDGTSNYAVY